MESRNSTGKSIEVSEASPGPQLSVALDIGAIELSPEELVSLRPGSEIVLERPKVLEGALRLGNSSWATVEIELHDNQTMRLVVKSLDILSA